MKRHISELIGEYGGSFKRLGVSKEFFEALMDRRIDFISTKLADRFLTEYNPDTNMNFLTEIYDFADYFDEPIVMAFESISDVPEVRSKLRKGSHFDFEGMLHTVDSSYHLIRGRSSLDMIIANIPRSIENLDTESGGNPNDVYFPVFDPTMRMDTLRGEMMDIRKAGEAYEGLVNSEYLPRNVKSIELETWLPRRVEGRNRKLGKEFNSVLITFKKDIPKEVKSYIDNYVYEKGEFIQVRHGDRKDWLIGGVWAQGREIHKDGVYKGMRPLLMIVDERTLRAYYAPVLITEKVMGPEKTLQDLNANPGYYAPAYNTLEILRMIQNKWLYDRPKSL